MFLCVCQSSCISFFPLLCVVLDILCIRGNKGILNLNLNLNLVCATQYLNVALVGQTSHISYIFSILEGML